MKARTYFESLIIPETGKNIVLFNLKNVSSTTRCQVVKTNTLFYVQHKKILSEEIIFCQRSVPYCLIMVYSALRVWLK